MPPHSSNRQGAWRLWSLSTRFVPQDTRVGPDNGSAGPKMYLVDSSIVNGQSRSPLRPQVARDDDSAN